MKEHQNPSPGTSTKVPNGHSQKGKLEKGYTNNRLTSSSFVHEAKKLEKTCSCPLSAWVRLIVIVIVIVKSDLSAVTISLDREQRMTIPSELKL